MKLRAPAIFLCLAVATQLGCGQPSHSPSDGDALDKAAEQFVRLGLEFSEYDSVYMDGYVGPEEWQSQAKEQVRSKEVLTAAIQKLRIDLENVSLSGQESTARHKSLLGMVRALDTRAQMLNGARFSFAEEARLLYGIEPPAPDFARYDAILSEIDELAAGEGEFADRLSEIANRARVPADKSERVFERALDECKRRTLEHIDLPEGENLRIEFVTNVNWAGFQVYEGDYQSLVQINDALSTVTGALNLACHEGYPGHHVQRVLLDELFVQDKGWAEYLAFPSYSPHALIIEGGGTYSVQLAFPGDEFYEFQRDVLAPLAGLDPDDVDRMARLMELQKGLFGATVATAQLYLDGDMSRETAIASLQKYGLMSKEAAEGQLQFIEGFRAYLVNFTVGEDLVAAYIRREARTEEDRWALYRSLILDEVSLSTP